MVILAASLARWWCAPTVSNVLCGCQISVTTSFWDVVLVRHAVKSCQVVGLGSPQFRDHEQQALKLVLACMMTNKTCALGS